MTFPILKPQAEIDREVRRARLREIAEDVVGCACLFVAFYGVLWIAPLLWFTPLVGAGQ